MKAFDKLGADVEARWRDVNYREDLFPTLAAELLRDADLPSAISAWDAASWALSEDELPRQRDLYAKFGDPPLTVYSASRFHIDIYFWFEGTTAIHQHGFCGAFQVLLGSSIHSWYEFTCREAINSFMQIGDLSLKVCELLQVGDVQDIKPGRQYIHSLFHLDHPSATIVVRTDRSSLDLPQFAYEKPCLAIDPFFEEPNTVKKLQLISALYRAGREDADEQVSVLLRSSDLQTSYAILGHVRRFLKSNHMSRVFDIDPGADRFGALVDTVAAKHPSAGFLKPLFARQEMLDEILDRRAYLTDPEHRFFLALLLNVDGRERIFDLVAKRYPGTDPLDKVLDWVFDLSQTRVMAMEKTNALGIADFGETDMFVLEDLLSGRSADESVEHFVTEKPGADPHHARKAIARLTNAHIFRPLLS